MRVLVVHNRYQQRGGEDRVVASEIELLAKAKIDVQLLEVNNDNIQGLAKIAAIGSAIYSFKSRRLVSDVIQKFQPDLIHCHNLFPLLSPSVYDAAKQAGIPVVQTLHNFRLFCANAYLFRDGDICERCWQKTVPLDAIRLGCYRNSRAASAAAVVASSFHKSTGIHQRNVSAFIALTNFSRRKFIEAGLPEAKLFVKPNFVELSPIGTEGQRNGFLFVGRISPEKGLRTLLEAWRTLQPAGALLKIIGDGPESQRLQREFSDLHVEWLGIRSRGDILRAMRAATAVVVPSLWYEGFPLVTLEAFSVGTPVIASAIGSLEEIVQDTVHGLQFGRGDAQDLSEKIHWANAHPTEMDMMGRNARRECELKYSEDTNLSQLLYIYESVLRSQPEHQSRSRVAAATD